MMWRLLTLCAAMVSMAMANEVLWEQYKEKHGLSFEDKEDTERLGTFKDNLKFINEHNAEADLGKHTYRLGINKFTHMTNKEFRAKVIGNCLLDGNSTKLGAPIPPMCTPSPIAANSSMPTSVDWRSVKPQVVTPIKNQGQCGSCWAFSTVASLESQWAMKHTLTSLSEQNLVDCSQNWGNFGCGGGLMDQGFTYIHDNNGIDTEASYAYTAMDGTCKFDKKNVGATLSSCMDISSGDEGALANAINMIGPISVAIDASHMSFQMYTSGVYYEPNCSPQFLDHGVTAVGYGTDNGKDYFLVKNSWGEQWGDKGYIKMSRNRNNNCGIATASSYPLL